MMMTNQREKKLSPETQRVRHSQESGCVYVTAAGASAIERKVRKYTSNLLNFFSFQILLSPFIHENTSIGVQHDPGRRKSNRRRVVKADRSIHTLILPLILTRKRASKTLKLFGLTTSKLFHSSCFFPTTL